jgi:hypothetical protein
MARTLVYVRYTTSANFGNMVSMALASLFLPFLPLLPNDEAPLLRSLHTSSQKPPPGTRV